MMLTNNLELGYADRKGVFPNALLQNNLLGITVGGNVMRDRFDANEFVFEGDICKVTLYDSLGRKTGETIIDNEDYDKVKTEKWYLSYYKYAISNKKQLLLHHLIMGKPSKGYEIDHKNMNTLDNRKANLRFCTRQQNKWNSGSRGGTSKYKGVSWNKLNKSWVVYISINWRSVYLGSFKDEVRAAKMYNAIAKRYYDEFAYLNDV